MSSGAHNTEAKESFIHDDAKEKEQAEWSYVSGADARTFEEREAEREVISRARPGGLERVASQQRLPAEGIGAAGGRLREVFDSYDPHSAQHVEPTEPREPERTDRPVSVRDDVRS